MPIMNTIKRLFGRHPSTRETACATVREDMMFSGRARLIVHMFDEFGEEASSEFSFDAKPPGFDPLLVFAFSPRNERTWWTYCTAGLSLCPAMDAHPPTELIAYSEVQSSGLVELLYQLSFKEDDRLSFRMGDILSFDEDPPDIGVPLSRDFGLLFALESEKLIRFPDTATQQEDIRYIMARPNENKTVVQFLRVVALANADFARFNDLRAQLEPTKVWKVF